MKNVRSIRRQAGVTGVELLIALAVIGALAVGAIALIGAFRGAQGESYAKIVATAFTNVQTKYSTANNFANVTTLACANNNVFPDNYVQNIGTATATITGPWGGAIACAPANVFGSANDGFSITIPNMPANVCRELPSRLTSTIARVTITPDGGTPVVVKATGDTSVNVGAVGTACGSGASTLEVAGGKA
jgi:type II secretory pathway pseudopilin PulG